MKQKKHRWSWDDVFTNFIFTLGILIAATVFCTMIHKEDSSGSNAAIMIFILAILFIARYTNGYKWGIAASFIGVIVVNFIFTYPFFELNFNLTGYPLTFLTMFFVSVITSTTSTQIKQSELRTLENEKERVRANLLRSMSHDIRTPLTSIVGATSVMLNEGNNLTEEQKHQLLTDINEDGQWLIRVTENILSITRVGGNTEIMTQPELAEELMESAIRKFRKRHPDAIPVEVILPDAPVMINMDIILVEQVLTNLMENAVVHGIGATKIKIRLETTPVQAIFSVMNDGVCIPDEKIPTLFSSEPNSDNNSTDNGSRCMGIGLAVCKTVINAHGGTIYARNLQNNEGVVFSFTLPIEKDGEL